MQLLISFMALMDGFWGLLEKHRRRINGTDDVELDDVTMKKIHSFISFAQLFSSPFHINFLPTRTIVIMTNEYTIFLIPDLPQPPPPLLKSHSRGEYIFQKPFTIIFIHLFSNFFFQY